LPAVLGLVLAIGGPVVGVEGVRGVGVDDDLGRLVRVLEGGAHAVDGRDGDARVGASVEAEDRGLDVAGQVDGVLRVQLVGTADEGAVPGHARLDVRVVRRVQPDDPAAPAEPGDAQPRRVRLAGGPGVGDGGVEVRHDLRVGDLGDHVGDDL